MKLYLILKFYGYFIGLPYNQDHIIIKLQGMITKFCSGLASHYPMKKILLLLWKLILVLLGGMTTLANLKSIYIFIYKYLYVILNYNNLTNLR